MASGINTPQDLIDQGLNRSTIRLYGAVHDSDRLGYMGPAFAQSDQDTIYLGEYFYMGNTYSGTGGDEVVTLIHETIQLGLVAANGHHTSDFTLDNIIGSGTFGSWGELLRANCGPR